MSYLIVISGNIFGSYGFKFFVKLFSGFRSDAPTTWHLGFLLESHAEHGFYRSTVRLHIYFLRSRRILVSMRKSYTIVISDLVKISNGFSDCLAILPDGRILVPLNP